jgi:hypothetical protein
MMALLGPGISVGMKPFQNPDGLPQAVLAVREWQRSGRFEHGSEMGGQSAPLSVERKRIFEHELQKFTGSQTPADPGT